MLLKIYKENSYAKMVKFGAHIKYVGVRGRALTLKQRDSAGVPYMEQIHLHRQRREFCIRNNAQKTKENGVKAILFSLTCLTPIKLPFCMSICEREREIFRKIFFFKSVRNHFTVK